MGLGIGYTKEDNDSLDVYLKGIIKDGDIAEKEVLEAASEKVKEYIVANLNKHKRSLEKRYKNRPAMADDVKITRRKGTLKISGGVKTGTLWHIVNDGTLHTMGIHFMDGALARLDDSIDGIWDKILR